MQAEFGREEITDNAPMSTSQTHSSATTSGDPTLQNGLMEQLGNDASTTSTRWQKPQARSGSTVPSEEAWIVGSHRFINLLVEYLSGYQGVDEATKTIDAPQKCLGLHDHHPVRRGSLTFARKDGKITMGPGRIQNRREKLTAFARLSTPDDMNLLRG